MTLPLKTILGATLACVALAHGDHSAKPKTAEQYENWMTRHMSEEHHMDGWDAGSFFSLHDFDSDGFWRADEMQRTYGLMDESNKEVSFERRQEIVRHLLELLDTNDDGAVSRDEWNAYTSRGETLPDMGTGPGHHGDDEYEYEIHHWEKYHDDNTKLEDLTHPEDIAHFKKHEEMEDEEARLEAMDQLPIVEANIPAKFLRQ